MRPALILAAVAAVWGAPAAAEPDPAAEWSIFAPLGSCTLRWAEAGGFVSVIATTTGDRLQPLVAMSIRTEIDCFAVSP